MGAQGNFSSLAQGLSQAVFPSRHVQRKFGLDLA